MGWSSWSVRSAWTAVLVVALLTATGPSGSGSATARFDDFPRSSARAVVPVAAPVAPRDRWTWPLHPVPAVARQFEAPPSPWAAGHRGVDLRTSPSAAVLSPADGVVTFAGVVVDRGVLVVAHAGGLRTSYEPVDPLVEPGDRVVAGEQLATVGTHPGHCAPGTCLHWGLRHGTTYLDPLRMVQPAGPPVLLPLPRREPGRQVDGAHGAGAGTESDGMRGGRWPS